MQNKILAGIAAVVVLGGIIFWMNRPEANRTANVSENDPMASQNEAPVVPNVTGGEEVPAPQREVKEFTVTGSDFAFSTKTITVNTGDTVRIKFVNSRGFHDFVIDEYQVKTRQLQGGEEEVVEFVADKPGTFEYYCSVGRHREMGMKGSLVVR